MVITICPIKMSFNNMISFLTLYIVGLTVIIAKCIGFKKYPVKSATQILLYTFANKIQITKTLIIHNKNSYYNINIPPR